MARHCGSLWNSQHDALEPLLKNSSLRILWTGRSTFTTMTSRRPVSATAGSFQHRSRAVWKRTLREIACGGKILRPAAVANVRAVDTTVAGDATPPTLLRASSELSPARLPI